MNTKPLFVTALLMALAAFTSAAANNEPDAKFQKTAAQEVWNMNLPEFNANTSVPDSLANGCAAVIIAEYNSIDAGRIESSQMGNFVDVERGYIGETTVNQIRRCMVKLLDKSAVEYYSEFSFDPKESQKIGSGLVIYEFNQAFGARIYKPNGLCIDVDPKEVVTVTTGKKESSSEHKLAIPGLETGDVLEFFYYTRRYFFGDQGIRTSIDLVSKYPIMDYRFVGAFDTNLTTEISTLNGITAGIFENKSTSDRNIMSLHLKNIEKFDNPGWCNKARQMPLVRLSIKDNLSRIFGTPESARRAGIYFNLPAPLIMAEVAEIFAKTTIPGSDASKAWGLVKDYRQAHPDATDSQIADAAWLAAKYMANVSKESYNQWDVVCLTKDLLEKAKLTTEGQLAVTTTHNDVPVECISAYTQATPMIIMGDRYYVGDANTNFLPGELPDEYHGEQAYIIEGERSSVFNNKQFSVVNLPDHAYRENTANYTVDITIPDPDATQLDFTYKVIAKGGGKSQCSMPLMPDEIIPLTEDYLNLPANKRSKREFDKEAVLFNKIKKAICDRKPKSDLGLENSSVDTVIVSNYSYTPGSPKLEYSVKGNVDGLVSSAGPDLLVKVGALSGSRNITNELLTEKRTIDICTSRSGQNKWSLNLHIPEGYTVDAAGLESLKVNKSNNAGIFYAQANYDEEQNIVKVSVMAINARRNYPAAAWQDFLDLRQAANDFSETTIVLHPKNKMRITDSQGVSGRGRN